MKVFNHPTKIRLFCLALACLMLGGCASFSEDKEMARLHLQIGTSQLENGNYPQAIEELLKAEKFDSSDAVIQNNLGLAYLVRERYNEAEQHIRKAVSLRSDYSDARNNLAQVLNEQGKYKEAIPVAQVVIDDLTYPNPEKPLITQGISNFKLGQFQAAQNLFSKSLKIQRDNCLANTYLGRCYYEKKQYKQAAESLDQAASYCQKMQFDEPQYYSGLAYYQLGEKEKATHRLEQLIKLYPQGQYSDKSKIMLETIRR